MKIENLSKTPKEAKQNGDLYFYTGKPCVNGHDSVRYTSNYRCKECNRIDQKKYNEKPHRKKYMKAYNTWYYRKYIKKEKSS